MRRHTESSAVVLPIVNGTNTANPIVVSKANKSRAAYSRADSQRAVQVT